MQAHRFVLCARERGALFFELAVAAKCAVKCAQRRPRRRTAVFESPFPRSVRTNFRGVPWAARAQKGKGLSAGNSFVRSVNALKQIQRARRVRVCVCELYTR